MLGICAVRAATAPCSGRHDWDAHVRNGDRYRVLVRGPDAGLIVEDLSGRAASAPRPARRGALRAGWASTITRRKAPPLTSGSRSLGLAWTCSSCSSRSPEAGTAFMATSLLIQPTIQLMTRTRPHPKEGRRSLAGARAVSVSDQQARGQSSGPPNPRVGKTPHQPLRPRQQAPSRVQAPAGGPVGARTRSDPRRMSCRSTTSPKSPRSPRLLCRQRLQRQVRIPADRGVPGDRSPSPRTRPLFRPPRRASRLHGSCGRPCSRPAARRRHTALDAAAKPPRPHRTADQRRKTEAARSATPRSRDSPSTSRRHPDRATPSRAAGRPGTRAGAARLHPRNTRRARQRVEVGQGTPPQPHREPRSQTGGAQHRPSQPSRARARPRRRNRARQQAGS